MIYKEIDNGKSKWIVLLHCVCGNERIFKEQMSFLGEYYNIAIIRLAGHQIESELHEATFDFVIEEIHDLAVKKGCKIDILGVSIGAMIATKYISVYPNDLDKLYLIGNIYGFSIPFLKEGYMLLTKINKLLPRTMYMYFITKAILPRKSQNYQWKKLYINSKKMKKEFLYSWMSEMGRFIMSGKAYFKLTQKSTSKVSLIYGEKDDVFLGWVKRNIKSYQSKNLYLIKDSGHLCNMEKPILVNKIIEEDNL